MQLLRHLASLLLPLVCCVAVLPLRAQPSPVARLRAALRQPLATVPAADSLLTQARQLGYVPGQIVALSQLASLRLQAQQPEQATPLLQEATQLASQLQDLKEEGWAMNQLGSVQRRLVRLAPATIGAYDPLVKELGAAMRRS